MIDALCSAYASVNNPTEDLIYQVTVRRGVPADAFALLGDTFEWYPVGGDVEKVCGYVGRRTRHGGRSPAKTGATSGACPFNDFRSGAFV